eukprot:TRINITY_DN7217_c0_g4_i1.p1 TRINITY_DN7217_c0_g4~~TRINITY_DN7217_c0_g4_i1.p1  ORF type:complete len:427 (+),score=69.04 TRINITY_DN7217_c0_g4_i1:49-1281(+)
MAMASQAFQFEPSAPAYRALGDGDVEFPDVALEPESEPFQAGATDEAKRVKAYHGMDTPFYTAKMLAAEDSNTALRVFLLDNSGSTAQPDGHLIQRGPLGTMHAVPGTRWQEICAIALEQATWNGRAGTHTEFFLLNPPNPTNLQEGRDFAVVDPSEGRVDAQVAKLTNMLEQNGPRGTTPLAQRLQQLRHHLASKPKVRDGLRIMLSIVTDGLPTSPQNGTCMQTDKDAFVQELRSFASTFNSFIVIRLATDDESVVNYYNDVDEELEFPLDILDDLQGEAEEIAQKGNGWFAYTPMLHRIREGGTLEKLFDLLDERPLTVVEISIFLELLFRGRDDPPFPRSPKELFQVAKRIVATSEQVFNGRLGRMTPPIDLKKLQSALGLSILQRLRALPSELLERFIRKVCFRN